MTKESIRAALGNGWGKVIATVLGVLVPVFVMLLIGYGSLSAKVDELKLKDADLQREINEKVNKSDYTDVLVQINQRLADIRADMRTR